jgi:hypothetical protein
MRVCGGGKGHGKSGKGAGKGGRGLKNCDKIVQNYWAIADLCRKALEIKVFIKFSGSTYF